MNIPLCPKCGDPMVRVHIEAVDRSGWFHTWSCACEDEMEWDPMDEPEYNNEVIVYAGEAPELN